MRASARPSTTVAGAATAVAPRAPSRPLLAGRGRGQRPGGRRRDVLAAAAAAAGSGTPHPLVPAAPPTAAAASSAANARDDGSLAAVAPYQLHLPPPPPSSAPPPSSFAWAPLLAATLVGVAVGVAGAWIALAIRSKPAADPGVQQQQQDQQQQQKPAATPVAAAPAAATASGSPPSPTPRRGPAGVSDAMTWYRRLPRVHFLEASADDGPVTRIDAAELGADVASALGLAADDKALIGFQDPADAEFVLACMAKTKAGNKGAAGVALASSSPAQVQGRLKAGQKLFLLPPGRLPIKATVSSEAGLRQLLKIGLLQDIADRAGAVFAAPSGAAAAAAAPAAMTTTAIVEEEEEQADVAHSSSPPPPPPLPLPPPPPAPRRPQQQQRQQRQRAAVATPAPAAPAAAEEPAAHEAKKEEEDEDDGFSPITLAEAVDIDIDLDRGGLLDEFYSLEQAWAADRVAQVASAARAEINRSIGAAAKEEEEEEEEKVHKVDRLTTEDDRPTTEVDRSTLVSKGLRKKRPGEAPPPKLNPEALQRSVLDALKEIDPERDERDKKTDSREAKPLIGGGEGDDGDDLWWKKRFRAVYLPTLHSYGPDGSTSAGFLQVDISSDGTAKDVRVIAFEDRYDAMACIATMAQIDLFAKSSTFSVGALPTEKVEDELRNAYLRQKAEGGLASAPSGVLVFRKGKLPVKPGMDEQEFVRAILLQGTAMTSLLSVGFKF